jgi:hypothetical protein
MTGVWPAVGRARRQLVRRFREAGAFSSDSALVLPDLTRLERSRLRRFLDNNIVHESAPQAYWLDRDRYALYLAHQRRLAVLGLIAVVIVLFFVVEIAGRP